MQACGNDFVVIDHAAGVPPGFKLFPGTVKKICDRHFGVGCDQLLYLGPSPDGHAAAVTIFNSDGSTSEMCGNGMRAIGLHLARRGAKPGLGKYSVWVESGDASRIVSIDLSGEDPEVALGVPRLISGPGGEQESIPNFGSFSRVEIGNPHAVFFFASEEMVRAVELERVGPLIERDPLFPQRTNVEIVAVLEARKIFARVWERGAGITLACGSGACAIVAAAEAGGLVDAGQKIEVVLPGGSVFVRLESGWKEGRGQVLLSGPAEDVFSTEWDFS